MAVSFLTRRQFNAAHLLTSVRLALTPVFLFAIAAGQQQPSPENTLGVIVLFLLICASDYYDGPLARALGVDSDFGKVFDNLADITFLLVTLTYFVHGDIVPWWIPSTIALAFAQYSLDSWLLAERKRNIVLFSNPIGHWAGILNYVFTGIMALYAALQQQGFPSLLIDALLSFWMAYLLLAIGMRLHFFLKVRGHTVKQQTAEE